MNNLSNLMNFILFLRSFSASVKCCMDWFLQVLKDKKLKGQLSVREELYGVSAKAAVKAEKVNFSMFAYFKCFIVAFNVV